MLDRPDLVADYGGAGFGRTLSPGSRPVLLVVDLVQAYFDPGCELYLGPTGCLESAARVLSAARTARVPVVHTRVTYAPGGVDGGAFFRKVGALRHFVGDGPYGAPCPQVAPERGGGGGDQAVRERVLRHQPRLDAHRARPRTPW